MPRAAMIFSFFIAVIVTPWLMLKFGNRHGARDDLADHESTDGHPVANWAGSMRRIARADAARPRRNAGAVLADGGRACCPFGSLALFYTRDR